MIKKLLRLFTRREKGRGAIVLMMAVGMAVLETAGVASVMLFLSLLGNPGIVETNPVLATAYEVGGFASVDAFLMVLGVGAFALTLSLAIFRSITPDLLPADSKPGRTDQRSAIDRLFEGPAWPSGEGNPAVRMSPCARGRLVISRSRFEPD